MQDPLSRVSVFHGGTYSSGSRDGERLVVCLADALDPPPDMLLRATSTGAFRAVPAPTSDSCEPLSQSDDGARVLLRGDFGASVHDAELRRLGWLRAPQGGDRFIGGAVLSPDGTRAYVLTYEEGSPHPLAPRARVWVHDTSRATPSEGELPALGSFELEDGPHCAAGAASCEPSWPLLAISPDGETLFASESQAVVVVPIPPELRSGALLGNVHEQ